MTSLLGKEHLELQSRHQQRIILPTTGTSGESGGSGGERASSGRSGGERTSSGGSGRERASNKCCSCSTGTRSGGSGLDGSEGGLFVTETKAGPETLERRVLTGGNELGVENAETDERLDL